MSKKFSVLIKKRITTFKSTMIVDSDKSITHRALFLSSQCLGISEFEGLVSEDVLSTMRGLQKLGIKIQRKSNKFKVFGNGISSFKKTSATINCGNSGTSARFFLGLLSTYTGLVKIIGDSSLQKRPMKRVTGFLEKIGAKIIFIKNTKTLPIQIKGTNCPMAQQHKLKIPSAQVKTAIILSALNTKGIVQIIEVSDTRDHTERLLQAIGGKIKIKKNKNKKIISVNGQHDLNPFKIKIPGDPSSACFFIILTLLSKKSSLLIKNVCVNKTRIGFIEILKKMNAKIYILNKRKSFGEEVADILVKSSMLKKINCTSKIIPRVIDELPALFIAASFAKGSSTFNGIEELRYKESDRIKLMEKGLNSLGIKTKSTRNSLKIIGKKEISFNKKIIINPEFDHRIAMSFYVAGQLVNGKVLIKNFNTVNSSFPNFLKLQKRIGSKHEIK